MRSADIIEHIESHIQDLPASYDRPAQKFIREVVFGAAIARTTLVSDIARAICQKSSKYAATYKRLIRRFSEVELEDLYLQQQNRAIEEITDDHIVAIDIGDITKPHSTSLEGLATVADGSDGHKLKPGFWLCGAVAVNPNSTDKTPQPVSLKLYSSESEQFYSENTIVNEVIENIFFKTIGKGIYTIDRGGDRSAILKPLFALNAKTIIRLNCRHIIDDDASNKEKEVIIKIGNREIKRKDLPYRGELERISKQGKRVPLKFRLDYKKISIKDIPSDQQLYLVTVWSLKTKKPMELLTTIPIQSFEDAISILMGYLSRWSVEEVYRFLKTDLNLEKVQLRSLGKIKNMIKLTFIVASILARMTLNEGWKTLALRHVKRQKRPTLKLFNWLYVLAEVSSELILKSLSRVLKKNDPIYFKHHRTPLERMGLFDWSVGL